MTIFFDKSVVDIETIVVSPDEQYVACFETGNGKKIRCFRANGTLAFDYNIPSDVSAGGYCTLWFDDQMLCSLYYRTNTVLCFSMDGTIVKSYENTSESRPPEFPSFLQMGDKYIYSGDQIEVIYNKCSFLGYWIFGQERYLAMNEHGDDMIIAYSWKARGQ